MKKEGEKIVIPVEDWKNILDIVDTIISIELARSKRATRGRGKNAILKLGAERLDVAKEE